MKKLICLLSCLVATAFSLYYSSLGGFAGNKGALSKIGLTHPVLFFIWGILTLFALSYNLIIGFSKTKHKFYIILLIIASVGMIMTLSFDFDYNNHIQYTLHCIGSLTFSATMGITVFSLFLLTKKYILTIISGIILIGDLILLIIYKETAFIELMPIFAGYIMLSVNNCRREKKLVEIK